MSTNQPKNQTTMEVQELIQELDGFLSEQAAKHLNFTEQEQYASALEVDQEESFMSNEPLYTPSQQKEIQGNLIPGFKKDYQAFLFLRMGSVEKAKDFLNHLAPQITHMQEVLEFKKKHKAAQAASSEVEPTATHDLEGATWVNIAFSYLGLRQLIGEGEAAQFTDEAFAQGMKQRSALLGDPAEGEVGSESAWKFGGKHEANEVHMVISIAADWADDRDEKLKDLREQAKAYELTEVYCQLAEAMPDPLKGHEHFGFKDGISDPAVRGILQSETGRKEYIYPRYVDPSRESADPDKDRSKYFAKPGQQLVWPGQFLVGEPRQDSYDLTNAFEQATEPKFPAWARLGSYMVCRRLEQDVPAFWSFVDRTAKALGLDRNRFAAQMIGRWPSGAPVMRSPLEDNLDEGGDDLINNHFLFDDKTEEIHLKKPNMTVSGTPDHDMLGLVCPHFAHIRKMHLRDSPTDLGPVTDTATRLILRRGIPYGPSLWNKQGKIKEELVNESRGLMFVCFNTSIVDQFEFISNKWANSPIQPNLGGHDPIIGQTYADNGARFIDMPVKDEQQPLGYRTERVELKEPFVTPTGGEYFFTPPISSLTRKGKMGSLNNSQPY